MLRPVEAHGHNEKPSKLEVFQRLHDDLQALAQRQFRRIQFERRWPVAYTAQWQWWQHNLEGDRRACLDLGCLLAYYAVDYHANIARLVRAHGQICEGLASMPVEAQGLLCLPDYLSIVYRKRRDTALLVLLLELRMPTARLYRGQWEAVVGLWDQHFLALLDVAAHSPLAQQTLLRALIHACRTVREPTLWRAYYRFLQHATYLRERQSTRVAFYLMNRLRQAERRYELE